MRLAMHQKRVSPQMAKEWSPYMYANGRMFHRKVNWMARAEHEYIPNYKALQVAFDKLDIERNIPVDQLIRAKYQDNLEFLQWVKCFWEREGGLGRLDYDPVAAREGKTLPPWVWAQDYGACEKENFKPRAPVARTLEVEKKPVSRPAPRQPVQTAARTPRSVNSSLNNSLNTSNSAETEALKVKVEAQNEVTNPIPPGSCVPGMKFQ
ncbi:Microtubule-associated protein RP/EB family member 1 [Symbiodinium microadriaticum]|uniref:Microtubule-associated protein RP/EB family member 1 n=1 Tax=Symbiodinium microadriaticum TaxID=2951 RepID=A0A1Q9E5Y1_SYMMI|nr:Microtubule-associated protein RP/EB family member 1 [Symbiodinium microadriaticum]